MKTLAEHRTEMRTALREMTEGAAEVARLAEILVRKCAATDAAEGVGRTWWQRRELELAENAARDALAEAVARTNAAARRVESTARDYGVARTVTRGRRCAERCSA